MQKKAYEKEQGLAADDDEGDFADDEGDEGEGEEGGGAKLRRGVSSNSLSAAGMAKTPLERAAAIAALISLARGFAPPPPPVQSSSSSLSSSSSSSSSTSSTFTAGLTAYPGGLFLSQPVIMPTADGRGFQIDVKGALARAKLLERQLAAFKLSGSMPTAGAGIGVGNLDADGEPIVGMPQPLAAALPGVTVLGHFSEELDINDYPPQARRKVTHKSGLDEVIERTGVAIIQRGSHMAPGKVRFQIYIYIKYLDLFFVIFLYYLLLNVTLPSPLHKNNRNWNLAASVGCIW